MLPSFSHAAVPYNQEMKRLLLTIALALAGTAVAFAQQGPPMGGGYEQMQQARQQFRAQVLAALTPAHRQLVASVIGSLAVAEHPNPQAAAKQLDAALSGSEKNAILAADKQMHDQMQQMFDQSGRGRYGGRGGDETPDAGQILLTLGQVGGMRGRP